jgi:probable rRNA maturation factor
VPLRRSRAARAAVGVAVEGTRIPVSRTRVAEVARAVLKAENVRDAMLSIAFVSNPVIRRMNKRHLGRDRVTDVIAFGFKSTGKHQPVVGDIYIAPGVARVSAAANGVRVSDEIVRLVVHGVLHVLGYDHPETGRMKSAMWRRQERLVARLTKSR